VRCRPRSLGKNYAQQHACRVMVLSACRPSCSHHAWKANMVLFVAASSTHAACCAWSRPCVLFGRVTARRPAEHRPCSHGRAATRRHAAISLQRAGTTCWKTMTISSCAASACSAANTADLMPPGGAKPGDVVTSVVLQPRSLLFFSNEAYTSHLHGIDQARGLLKSQPCHACLCFAVYIVGSA